MTEISTYVMPEYEARRLTERIRITAHTYAEARDKLIGYVEEAREGSAHLALGYSSWTAYLAEVLGEEPMRLARDERREVVKLLSDEGMSTRAIAPIVGAARNTVMSDLKQVAQSEPPEPAHVERTVIAKQRHVTLTDAGHVDRTTGEILDTKPITGMDGKTYNRPTPATPRTPPRRALTDQFFDAVYDMTKQIERVERLTNDDRFNANKEKVAQKHLNDLIQTHDLLQQVIDSLSN